MCQHPRGRISPLQSSMTINQYVILLTYLLLILLYVTFRKRQDFPKNMAYSIFEWEQVKRIKSAKRVEKV